MRALNDCIKENKKELTDEQAVSILRHLQMEIKDKEKDCEAIDELIKLYINAKDELRDNKRLLRINKNINEQVLAEKNNLEKELWEYKTRIKTKIQFLETQHLITKRLFPNTLNKIIEEFQINFLKELLKDE